VSKARPPVASWVLRGHEMASNFETDYTYHHGMTTGDWKQRERDNVEKAYQNGTTLVRDGRYVCYRGHRFNETFKAMNHGIPYQACPWCMTKNWDHYTLDAKCGHDVLYDEQCDRCWRWVEGK
jgi:hypothetical protein